MKKIISAVFLIAIWILFMVPGVAAADIPLAWDNVSGVVWEKVRIYEKVGTTSVLKLEVSGTATSATLPNVAVGTHIYIARAFAAGCESDDSNSVSAVVKPATVPNFRIGVTVAEDGTVTLKLLAEN